MHKHKHTKQSKREVRVQVTPQKFEIRSNADGSRSISGYAAVFGSLSEDLGGFREKIAPGAFAQSLRDNPDVLCLYGHDSNQILGRVSSGTLTIAEDSVGLRFTCKLPSTSTANDLIALMERGDLGAMSFGFSLTQGGGGDEWTEVNGQVIRTLTNVVLWEVSVVGQPAYSATSVDLRSCPVTLRSKLNLRDETDDDDNDDDDLLDDEDTDEDFDNESEDYRCSYRCMACRSADFAHQSNLQEDDPAERSKRSAAVKTALSEDDLAEEQRRCAYRCAACRSLLSGHFPVPNGDNEDDPVRAAHLDLLIRRMTS
jgi:HK97 family phage prohead protease